MEVLTVKLGEPIEDGNYPPRMLLAEFFNGVATILRVNHPEEDTDTLRRHAKQIRRQHIKQFIERAHAFHLPKLVAEIFKRELVTGDLLLKLKRLLLVHFRLDFFNERKHIAVGRL